MSKSTPLVIYHERQAKQLCALHALNNLFQDPTAFSKKDLDTVCKELAPKSRFFNPHKSTIGLGCYDVNVIIAALAKKDYDVVWFDKRKDIEKLKLEHIFGFILNVPNNGPVPLNYLPWSTQKHWICIRKVQDYYYDLDSKLDKPEIIGNEIELIKFLKHKCAIDQLEILVIVPQLKTDIFKDD